MLFASSGSVRMVKNCGRRPQAAFSSPRSQFFFLVSTIYILGFHQSCDQNKNRNHPMKKVKSLRCDR